MVERGRHQLSSMDARDVSLHFTLVQSSTSIEKTDALLRGFALAPTIGGGGHSA